ncbi:MAG TPA: Flp family type IVb pilin [Hyphomicrobiales bacterium]|nr:Flp family type IVb pilin [Hyphomicrobiales bacterium]
MKDLIANKLRAFRKDEKGVTLLEYGILAALIAAVCIGTIVSLGGDINTALSNVASTLKANIPASK